MTILFLPLGLLLGFGLAMTVPVRLSWHRDRDGDDAALEAHTPGASDPVGASVPRLAPNTGLLPVDARSAAYRKTFVWLRPVLSLALCVWLPIAVCLHLEAPDWSLLYTVAPQQTSDLWLAALFTAHTLTLPAGFLFHQVLARGLARVCNQTVQRPPSAPEHRLVRFPWSAWTWPRLLAQRLGLSRSLTGSVRVGLLLFAGATTALWLLLVSALSERLCWVGSFANFHKDRWLLAPICDFEGTNPAWRAFGFDFGFAFAFAFESGAPRLSWLLAVSLVVLGIGLWTTMRALRKRAIRPESPMPSPALPHTPRSATIDRGLGPIECLDDLPPEHPAAKPQARPTNRKY